MPSITRHRPPLASSCPCPQTPPRRGQPAHQQCRGRTGSSCLSGGLWAALARQQAPLQSCSPASEPPGPVSPHEGPLLAHLPALHPSTIRSQGCADAWAVKAPSASGERAACKTCRLTVLYCWACAQHRPASNAAPALHGRSKLNRPPASPPSPSPARLLSKAALH